MQSTTQTIVQPQGILNILRVQAKAITYKFIHKSRIRNTTFVDCDIKLLSDTTEQNQKNCCGKTK